MCQLGILGLPQWAKGTVLDYISPDNVLSGRRAEVGVETFGHSKFLCTAQGFMFAGHEMRAGASHHSGDKNDLTLLPDISRSLRSFKEGVYSVFLLLISWDLGQVFQTLHLSYLIRKTGITLAHTFVMNIQCYVYGKFLEKEMRSLSSPAL